MPASENTRLDMVRGTSTNKTASPQAKHFDCKSSADGSHRPGIGPPALVHSVHAESGTIRMHAHEAHPEELEEQKNNAMNVHIAHAHRKPED